MMSFCNTSLRFYPFVGIVLFAYFCLSLVALISILQFEGIKERQISVFHIPAETELFTMPIVGKTVTGCLLKGRQSHSVFLLSLNGLESQLKYCFIEELLLRCRMQAFYEKVKNAISKYEEQLYFKLRLEV